ncbi:Primary amine oxidase precursor [Cedecea neteri]|uniref:Amine oxidase n=1 Tax=Cedecea neteri TaxID=158822 RepID=A0A2X3IMX5_9ENTR|nr:Primary amine oxidase precursor [Cedecea neteri]
MEIIKGAADYKPNIRFTEISLREPPKEQVWKFVMDGTSVSQPREADVIMLDGRHIIEATVDLAAGKVKSWKPIEGAQGMVLLDDFASVQSIINNSKEFAEAVKKRGISDPSKVVTTPLTGRLFRR